MARLAEGPRSRQYTWYSYVRFVIVALTIAMLLVGACMLYRAISDSLQAEKNLHATLFTICLVEQFVHESGRWPESWRELERMSFPNDAPSPLNGEPSLIRIGGSHGYDWPSQSMYLQGRVTIDFGVNPDTIINQDSMEFEAIKPNGPCYDYSVYGFVSSLQETLKLAELRLAD